MTMHATCNFCGEAITDELLMVRLSAHGERHDPDGVWGHPGSRRSWVRGDVAHCHANEEQDCWAEMLDRIGLMHEVSTDLSRLASSGRTARSRAESRGSTSQEREATDENLRAWHHVGGVDMLLCRIPGRPLRSLKSDGYYWLDQVDGLSDDELRAVKGIGDKSLRIIRQQLEAYYWRGDPRASRDLWTELHARFSRHVSFWSDRTDRTGRVISRRVAGGVSFAEQVLREDGAPVIADIEAPRKAVENEVA